MGSIKTQNNILEYIKKIAVDNIFTVATKKQLATDIGISLSTLSSSLKELEERKLIVVVSKKGKNGGIVITVVPEEDTSIEGFLNTDGDIITSVHQYAKELKEKYFPTYTYERRENRRRTKLEMVQYNAIKDEHRKMIADLNFMLSTTPYPSKELFKASTDPEGYYKAYLLCKLYDQLCITHMSVQYDKHMNSIKADMDEEEKKTYMAKAKFYQEQIPFYLTKNSITTDFFSSRNFNTMYNFYNKVKDVEDFNIFKYMQNVFKTVTYKFEAGYSNLVVPALNFFSSDKYLNDYTKYISVIHTNVNNTSRHLGSNPSDLINSKGYSNNPAISQLQILFNRNLDDPSADMESIYYNAMDIKDVELGFIKGEKHLKLLSYVEKVEEQLEGIDTEEKDKVMKFVKQLVINEYSPSSFSKVVRTSLFPLQRQHLVNKYSFNNTPLKTKLLEIGLVNEHPDVSLLEPSEKMAIQEMAYDFVVLSKYSHNYYILRMFADYMGYEINVRDIEEIINKYNLKGLIPFTECGMLDISKID